MAIYGFTFVNVLNVDFLSPTCAHQVSAQPVPEVMEHTVSVFLHHLCVNVKARIPQLGDFLGKKLHSLSRVAEDDGLVDLKLRLKREDKY